MLFWHFLSFPRILMDTNGGWKIYRKVFTLFYGKVIYIKWISLRWHDSKQSMVCTFLLVLDNAFNFFNMYEMAFTYFYNIFCCYILSFQVNIQGTNIRRTYSNEVWEKLCTHSSPAEILSLPLSKTLSKWEKSKKGKVYLFFMCTENKIHWWMGIEGQPSLNCDAFGRLRDTVLFIS